MSETRTWEIVCPNRQRTTVMAKNEDEALLFLSNRWDLAAPWRMPDLLRAAGYRAEPIEEPKMVTVRADLLVRAHNVIDQTTEFDRLAEEIRAALESAK